MGMCLLVVPEPTPIKFHQNDYKKVNSTRKIPVNTQEASNLHKYYKQLSKGGSRSGGPHQG